MLAGDVQAVLSHYALPGGAVRDIQPLANAGGWSGSRLWRVTIREGAFDSAQQVLQLETVRLLAAAGIPAPVLGERVLCLRRWPMEHPSKLKLTVNHSILRRIAASLPVVAYPFKTAIGQTYVEHAGYLWEVTDWRPGKADFHSNPNPARLRAAMLTLARFHELSAIQPSTRFIPRAIFERWRLCREMDGDRLATIEHAMAAPLEDEINVRARRMFELARQQVQSLIQHQRPAALEVIANLLRFHVIRDVHHDHILFGSDEVTGVIDFGAMDIDTPLTDIARLVGSFVGDDRSARQLAYDAYSEIRPLSEDDRRIIDFLDLSGVVFGALNWLTWLYVERRDMGPVEPIVKRLDQILSRLENRG